MKWVCGPPSAAQGGWKTSSEHMEIARGALNMPTSTQAEGCDSHGCMEVGANRNRASMRKKFNAKSVLHGEGGAGAVPRSLAAQTDPSL